MDASLAASLRRVGDALSPGWTRMRVIIENLSTHSVVELKLHPRSIAALPLPHPNNTVTPVSGCRADILTVLHAAGQRLTTNRILDALEEAGMIHGESTVKMALAEMVRTGVLTNDNRAEPKGYAIAEARLADHA
jgi:hypothetical protein